MSFIFYDVIFLVLFVIATVLFLYRRRNNLKREGIMYLYRTRVGIKFIEWASKKFQNFLKAAQYLVVFVGLSLMISMIYLLIKFSYLYLTSPYIAKALKIPVIFPLVPYLPEIFKIDILPPFYFTYWIIIIAIIAIPHEFAHGIFARLNKIKIHSTGFGFLGPFLAAFVEPDEKQTKKSSKFSQLSILGAGTFANILVAIIFVLLLWGFFALTFVPSGVNFNGYTSQIMNFSEISSVNGVPLSNLSSMNVSSTELINISANNKTYFLEPSNLKKSLDFNLTYTLVYEDSPALKARLSSPIIEIDGQKINSIEMLGNAILSHSPGDEIRVKALKDNKEVEYNITLGEKNGKPLFGIGFISYSRSGILGWFYSLVEKVKDPFIYYKSSIGDLGFFIFDLFWWIVMISLSVALVNMTPVGIFDGGRFFYLIVLAITKKEKIAKKAFALSTWLILLLVAAMMLKWLFAIVM